jgi:hypothetical protein
MAVSAKLLKNEQVSSVTSVLDRYGCEYKIEINSKHYKIHWHKGDEKDVMVVAKTASDWRAAKNDKAETQRQMRKHNISLPVREESHKTQSNDDQVHVTIDMPPTPGIDWDLTQIIIEDAVMKAGEKLLNKFFERLHKEFDFPTKVDTSVVEKPLPKKKWSKHPVDENYKSVYDIFRSMGIKSNRSLGRLLQSDLDRLNVKLGGVTKKINVPTRGQMKGWPNTVVEEYMKHDGEKKIAIMMLKSEKEK